MGTLSVSTELPPQFYNPDTLGRLLECGKMAAPVQDDFKVCVESLHINRIKEINYEGEESLQE